MIDVGQKKEKIISFIKDNGPSLPVRIAKTIEMEPVFASAILSELLNEKRIKMSNLRVGSSSLYLLQGQEKMLEDFADNLKSVEKEAFLKLKEKIVLEDEKEEPAIRVALRNIKDFAIPFEKEEKLFWRYSFTDEDKLSSLLNPKQQKVPKKEENKEVKKEEKEKVKLVKKREKIERIFFKESSDKEDKPEFLNEVKKFLEKREIDLIEEIKTEKREIIAKVKIKTRIGEIKFLLVAKNKTSTNKEELNAAIQQANYNKMPCLLLLKKEPSGLIKKILEENNLIKLLVM